MIDIIASPTAAHQNDAAKALQEGLSLHGIESRIVSSLFMGSSNIVACWGWRLGKKLLRLGKKVLVIERSYIGDRFYYYSLGWNGLNNYASFPEYPDDNGKRFLEHGGVIKPWKKTGDYILILGQVKGDASLKGQDIMPWYIDIAKKAYKHYGLPVYYRPHPESVRRRGYERLDGIENIGGSLEEAMRGALFTIAYNSNSCLDSILSGIPCYAGDKGTMAWDLCMKDIKELYYPDREKIAHQIAWKQWTIDEIRSGIPFRKLFE